MELAVKTARINKNLATFLILYLIENESTYSASLVSGIDLSKEISSEQAIFIPKSNSDC